MPIANARRERATYLTLCVLAASSLVACGQVGVGSGGGTLSTQGQSVGSTVVTSSNAPAISGTPAADAMVGRIVGDRATPDLARQTSPPLRAPGTRLSPPGASGRERL